MDEIPGILSIVKDVLLIGAVAYGAYEYFLFRKSKAITEDELIVDWYQTGSNEYLLDIQIKVKNKGQVRKYIKRMSLSVKTLKEGDLNKSIVEGNKLKFSRSLKKKYIAKNVKNNILEELPREKENIDFWVDPHTTQIFYYPMAIEAETEYVQVNCDYEMGRSGVKYMSQILELNKSSVYH